MLTTKSIRLTEEEVAFLDEYVAATGEVEATALKNAALRGLRQLRVNRGIMAYLEGHSSASAAAVAGIPRAQFLQVLVDKGITVLQGPSTLASEVETLARRFGDEGLTDIVRNSIGERAGVGV